MESVEISINEEVEKEVEISINEEVKKAVDILINEEEKAVDTFQGEFEFEKMDKMIYRFPAGLGGISNNYPYIFPRVVAIGPYHHSKEHLKKMEEKKMAAAKYFCRRWRLKPEEAYKKVLSVVDKVREKYIADEIMEDFRGARLREPKIPDDAYFAAMMFRDACFLLLYMEAVYSKSYGKEEDHEVYASFRRFLFSNRDSIDNDIMLLENQLPWQVVEVLIGEQEAHTQELRMVVGKFIARMGETFKVTEFIKREDYKWWDEKRDPPPHLLGLLRRYKIESDHLDKNKTKSKEPSVSDDEKRCLPLRRPLFPRQEENPKVNKTSERQEENPGGKKTPERQDIDNKISAFSPMELEEIGIKLTANETAAFSDMNLVKGCLLGELSLAPLSLSDTRASCLVNMAAFEVCTASRYGADPNNTAVCSYLALLAMFMVRKEDVHKLRSMGLLHGPHSNKEMLKFFKSVMMHLPDSGFHFARIMKTIEEYKHKRYFRIILYKWFYNNYMTIIKVLSILATLIGLYSGLYSAIRSVNQKN